MIVALLGFATAVIGSHISVATAGGAAIVIWPGAALSLYWLGLIGSVVTGLDFLGRVSVPLGVLAARTGDYEGARRALSEALRLTALVQNSEEQLYATYNLADLQREREAAKA